MFLEDNAAHPVGCDSQLQIVMTIRRTFFSLKLLGRVCQSAADYVMAVWRTKNKKNAPNGHYHLNRAVTPDQITQQNGLQREGGQ